MAAVWDMTHSVETDAPPDVAWKYWTNIENWIDPPAEFELDGPFVDGARGVTRIPGQPPLHWIIRELHPPETASIETQLEGALLSFEWRFAGLADARTRLTKNVALRGENAGVYVPQLDSILRMTLPEGMKKIADRMATAHSLTRP
jgi:hypothetical protein